MRWVSKTIDSEARALERARRRFVRKPSERRLHDVRTTGRRLRTLLEAVADLEPRPKLLRRVKRTAKLTDAARDAGMLARILEGALDDGERPVAQSLLDELRARKRQATGGACKRLRHT